MKQALPTMVSQIIKELKLTVKDNPSGVSEWSDGVRVCAKGMLEFINNLKK